MKKAIFAEAMFSIVLTCWLVLCPGHQVVAADTVTAAEAVAEAVPGQPAESEKPPEESPYGIKKAPKITVRAQDDSTIKISWKKVKSAEKYIIYRAKNKDGKYKKIKSTARLDYKDKDVIRTKTYYYKVCAVAGRGKEQIRSPFSKRKSAAVRLTRPVWKESTPTSSEVKLRWRKYKYVRKYIVYRSEKKDGKFEKIAETSNCTYTDREVKDNQLYYYKLQATGRTEKGKKITSALSKAFRVRIPKKVRTIAYVGDSVMEGMSDYRIITDKDKKVITKVGVSPYNFYNGPIMDQLLDYNPDRVYVMLGMNSLVGSPSDKTMDSIIKDYRKILEACADANPDIQIIILPVSPTRPAARVKNSIINKFNSKLEKMAENLNADYFDYTDFLKGSDGTLLSQYSAKDGIHWKISAYKELGKRLDEYDKKFK